MYKIELPQDVKQVVVDVYNTLNNIEQLHDYLSNQWNITKAVEIQNDSWIANAYKFYNSSYPVKLHYSDNSLLVNKDSNRLYPLLFVDKSFALWRLDVHNIWNLHYSDGDFYIDDNDDSASPVILNDGRFTIGTFVQSAQDLENIAFLASPYLFRYSFFEDVDIRICALIPQIEILDKAGYGFIKEYKQASWEDFINGYSFNKRFVNNFNSICSLGTKPKKIFKCSKKIYSNLKDDDNLEFYIDIMKADNISELTEDSIKYIRSNFSLTTFRSFMSTYLDIKKWFPNVDINAFIQAIHTVRFVKKYSVQDAERMVRDYCGCCNYLHITPSLTNANVVAEHDRVSSIYAKYLRTKDTKEIPLVEQSDIYDYAEDDFFVKVLRNKLEFLDESVQQQNCVSIYYSGAMTGKYLIWVARRRSDPSKSWITLMPNKRLDGYSQKYYAYNKRVTETPVIAFLKRALKHAQEVKNGTADRIHIDIKDDNVVINTIEVAKTPTVTKDTEIRLWLKQIDEPTGAYNFQKYKFSDLYSAIFQNVDFEIINVIGNVSIATRNKVFWKLSELYNKSYKDIRNTWQNFA